METIDIHSKSFVVKWIQIPDNSTIIFQLKPIKRSINFAIYRSNESNTNTPYGLNIDNIERKNSSSSTLHRRRSNTSLSLTLEERLKQSALDLVESFGTLSGNELFTNQLKIEEGGIFAFIFDNTRSKNYSRKVLFNKFFISNENSTPNLSSSNSSINIPNQLHPAKGQFLQGYLLKKKRKKLQGFTKRFFILNFKYNTLSYYLNENSLKIRGEMQINISTISAFKDENTIVIDSGMEIWILKTPNKKDWDNWINALDFIKLNHNTIDRQTPSALPIGQIRETDGTDSPNSILTATGFNNNTLGGISSNNRSKELNSINEKLEKLTTVLNSVNENDTSNISSAKSELNNLTVYVKSLLSLSPVMTVNSPSSIFSEDYFDALDSLEHQRNDHVYLLPGQDESKYSVDELSDDESIQVTGKEVNKFHDDLSPLPIQSPVNRRNDITKSTTQPQSLFTFLRKNVGKDLSTISMPVTSNEPLTILQKIAETFEHSYLLNEAALETDDQIKLLKIATFAISSLSSLRSKERNLRKPFNPILGETFEFVSDTLGFRLLGEKINHKPQIFAFNVESKDWELSFTLNPEQKFWGKSVELINKGTVTLILKKNEQVFKWTQPTTLLKNIITGERYSEPSNSISVSSSLGLKSTVEFKKSTGGSLFSGPSRSEEIKIEVFDEKGNKLDSFAEGTWTDSIFIKNSKVGINSKIWKASKLLIDENIKWGFTEFASNLNQITDIEKDYIPFTDSRQRPDVKAYELGKVDIAEKSKLEIEQRQRDRRKVLEDAGLVHEPNFFIKLNELEYDIVSGKKNYWERRKTHDWDGIHKLW